MTENHWQIGDFVTANINGKKQNMIISGTFTDYMQLGKSARLNSQINCDQETMFDYWSIMVNVHRDVYKRQVLDRKRVDEYNEEDCSINISLFFFTGNNHPYILLNTCLLYTSLVKMIFVYY